MRKYSFIIPVYNRPEETEELLGSLSKQDFTEDFEVVIVEDGSTLSSKEVIKQFSDKLTISYFEKPNTGPGDSRNYGMKHAKGNYFIVLDSDCILPPHYLSTAHASLEKDYVDCYGGPDTDHPSFTNIQKAINYVMTSFLTTGGIRGGKTAVNKFQPRSFNMGISKEAFNSTQGFGQIHPGEDPDLTIRLWKAGYKTKLIKEAYVHHKRRIDWKKFYKQVNKFGLARPILNSWHPETAKVTYWFPTLFILGFIIAVILAFTNFMWPLYVYGIYFAALFIHALISTKSISIAIYSLWAVCIQFIGYGWGFLKSTFLVGILKKDPQQALPHMFFKL
jgi:GT2 family glycosyltransferase